MGGTRMRFLRSRPLLVIIAACIGALVVWLHDALVDMGYTSSTTTRVSASHGEIRAPNRLSDSSSRD